MPKRVFRSVLATFSAPAARYPPDPRALFVLNLCVLIGVPLIFGNAAPGSIASKLDQPWVITWGVMLSAGSLVALMGVARQSVNGILFEQIGSVAVGFACVIYATAIAFSVGWSGLAPLVIVLGWGSSCLWRWFQLQRLMVNTERIVREAHEDE
jgi:hypothetical protein